MNTPSRPRERDPWVELFRRRREVLAWLIGAVLAFAVTALLLRQSVLVNYVPFVVASGFGVGYMRSGRRLGEVPCPRCGGKFFERPLPTPASRYVNVLAARPHCEHCGIGYLERIERQVPPEVE